MKIIPLSIPTPFPIGDVNVYLVREDPVTLIDAGPKTPEAETALREKLREHSIEFADLRRIVLTHSHEDHCGLAKRLHQESGAKIFIHEWETGHLSGRFAGTEYRNLMMRAGMPAEIFEELKKTYAEVNLFADNLEKSDCSALDDGMEFEFSGGVLKVLHTPGHTPGSCSFLREADRTVIAGDTVLKRVTPNPFIAPDPFDKERRFASLGELLVSLAKIKNCAPTLVYGGHGEPVYDFDEIFNRYVRAADERQRDVVRLISGSDGLTAYQTARKLFPDAIDQKFHRFLAISETVAHLDYAVQMGKIGIELKDAQEFYRQ